VKEQIVHTEVELADTIRKLLDKNLFRIIGTEQSTPHGRSCLGIRAEVEGRAVTFVAECKLNPTRSTLEQVAAYAIGKQRPLLITVRLSESFVAECRERGVSCLDLNGRVWIKAPGILIDRNIPNPSIRYRLAESDIRFFSPKSTRLARALLSYPDRVWRQQDLAEITGLSQGLVSRLLNHAAREGWVEGRRGDWKLTRIAPLLDEWARADDWLKRITLRQYSTLTADFPGLARTLAEKTVGDIAFTQWFAANLRFPYTQPPVVSAYRREFPSPEEAEALNLREVNDGGKLWLLVSRDTGVFQTVRRIEGFPVVCDAQIYLDLLQVGLRGPDQAKALREWAGFCKP
jgi:hypothetical protein